MYFAYIFLYRDCPHGIVVVYDTTWNWEDEWMEKNMDRVNNHYIPGASARILGKCEYTNEGVAITHAQHAYMIYLLFSCQESGYTYV